MLNRNTKIALQLLGTVIKKHHVLAWQAEGWGERIVCPVSADVVGPRLCISDASDEAEEACLAVAFGTVPVLQVRAAGSRTYVLCCMAERLCCPCFCTRCEGCTHVCASFNASQLPQ